MIANQEHLFSEIEILPSDEVDFSEGVNFLDELDLEFDD